LLAPRPTYKLEHHLLSEKVTGSLNGLQMKEIRHVKELQLILMHGTVFAFHMNQSKMYLNADEMFAIIRILSCYHLKKVINATYV
jgi:hypothetical protein